RYFRGVDRIVGVSGHVNKTDRPAFRDAANTSRSVMSFREGDVTVSEEFSADVRRALRGQGIPHRAPPLTPAFHPPRFRRFGMTVAVLCSNTRRMKRKAKAAIAFGSAIGAAAIERLA